MPKNTYKHGKISGPVKGFFEGTAGVFFVLAALVLFGVGSEGVKAAMVLGTVSLISFGISALIPAKNQFTQR